MKILREYVWDTLRRNKRTSIAIMTALFLMTTMMSCFCGFVYTMWTDMVALSVYENGNWHGELFDDTKGGSLEFIENYDSVETVLVKGPWEVAKLSDEGKRIYLITRGADEEYWNSMPEKNVITEGRIPAAPDEIAVSKQYFDDYPQTKVGDVLTLPVGERIQDGEICMETVTYKDNETFHQTGTKSYKIVGVMDVATSSSVPAYTAMSYLDKSTIRPEDEVTVYLRFDSMRETYEELPELAKAIGYEKDEYEKYSLKYNAELLSKYLILPPEQFSSIDSIQFLAMPLMFVFLAVMVVAVFVLVIHNAFALSANEKLVQLGTLAGIGASPKQMKSAVLWEARILLIIPLPPGILCGYLLDKQLFRIINEANDIGRTAPDIVLTFGLWAILPAVFLSVITALISAWIPARKVARMTPVEAVRHVETLKGRKIRRSRIAGHFGISGELAGNALAARRKSYRTAVISLCLSFLLLTGFLYIVTAQQASGEIYRPQEEARGHIFLSVSDGRTPEPKAVEEFKGVSGISDYLLFNEMPCATWVTREQTSEEMDRYLGGIDGVVAEKKYYSPIARDGKYRIYSELIGLEEDSFRAYCEKLGIDPEPYFSDGSKALIYNSTLDPHVSTKRKGVYRDILKIEPGQVISFTERAYDEDTGDYEFDLTAGEVVQELPTDGLTLSKYTFAAIMPMEHVLDIAAFCSDKRRSNASSLHGIFYTDASDGISYSKIRQVSDKLNGIVGRYYGSGDYLVSDLAERAEMREQSNRVIQICVVFLTGLLALIGLSNVWASISGNLRQRSREFAMLKSVGLSQKQLGRMLFLEGLNLGLKPVFYSVPFQAAVLGVFLYLNEITLAQYLPYAPLGPVLGYTGLVLAVIIGAYYLGSRRIRRENIIDAIKDTTI